MATIDYNVKPALPELFRLNRWNTLTVYMVHKNIRNRAYPGDEIFKRYGLSHAPVVAARRWLVQHGALEEVPYDKRVGDELRLPAAKKIYQLTGVIQLDADTIPYMFFNSSYSEQSKSSENEQSSKRGNSSENEHKDSIIPKLDNTSAPRARDVVFDAFAESAWNLPANFDTAAIGKDGAVIGKIAAAFRKSYPDMDADVLASLIRDCYRRWRAASTLHVPRLSIKFLGFFTWCISHDEAQDRDYDEFRGSAPKPSASGPQAKPDRVEHPDKPGVWISRAEYNRIQKGRQNE